jgi:hypothetical protein
MEIVRPPLGTMAASSCRGKVAGSFLSGRTRRAPMTSGLKRPPVRSFLRLSMWCSPAFAKAASRSERSKGSPALGFGVFDLDADPLPLFVGAAAPFLDPFSCFSALFFLACGAAVWEKQRAAQHVDLQGAGVRLGVWLYTEPARHKGVASASLNLYRHPGISNSFSWTFQE